ncbi:MAG: hypothetical protein ACI8TX_003045 [Hyphomicrobiaceae bacterium]|jgi:hypothetical protein
MISVARPSRTVPEKSHFARRLQDLLRHQFPNADPSLIVSRALELLLDDTLKKKARTRRQTLRYVVARTISTKPIWTSVRRLCGTSAR